MTTKAAAISNTCASVIGGCLLYFANDLPDEQIKLAATSLIPGLTLFIAFVFKVAASYGVLGLFKLLLKRKAKSQLDSLEKAINNPHISEEKRQEYRKAYEEALDVSMQVDNEDIRELVTMTDEARTNLKSDIASGYRDNKELSESLAAESKPTNTTPQP
ncbi:hypothetical protein [Pseudoalteromonas viridis]|uniref:Uncharacterized protein n=1 Tax=Pseudoalteromonas viridis TaxID=339617 RepID=A0ABX7VA30_9GAMM|nr:hypothetical protein [Pseudoalteromonas viridis]QTL37751.1 hypothetical protein J5X90_23230 [Pseudoalteromonas viridis]